MTTITYIEHDGTEHKVSAEDGISVMENALQNGVPGIDADCGGQCSCATCHVFVDPAWMETVGTRSEMEVSMLDLNPEANEYSRLSCQIPVTEVLDGLVVRMPEFQA